MLRCCRQTNFEFKFYPALCAHGNIIENGIYHLLAGNCDKCFFISAYACTAQANFFYSSCEALHFNNIPCYKWLIEKNNKRGYKIFKTFFCCQCNGSANNA